MSTEHNTQSDGSFSLEQWAESPIAAYARYGEYMEHVDPLVTALQEECRKRGFPMAFIVTHTQHADGNTAVAQGMFVPGDLRLRVHRTTTKAMSGLLDA